MLTYYSDQYLRGDESNQNPTLPGYAVVNLHSSYTVTKHLELFANVQNLFNARYATFAQYGDPTGVGAPGVPAERSSASTTASSRPARRSQCSAGCGSILEAAKRRTLNITPTEELSVHLSRLLEAQT